jgi:hypothetical protein
MPQHSSSVRLDILIGIRAVIKTFRVISAESNWPIALDRHTMHEPSVSRAIVDRKMVRAPVGRSEASTDEFILNSCFISCATLSIGPLPVISDAPVDCPFALP